jgi:hypothetical protein
MMRLSAWYVWILESWSVERIQRSYSWLLGIVVHITAILVNLLETLRYALVLKCVYILTVHGYEYTNIAQGNLYYKDSPFLKQMM